MSLYGELKRRNVFRVAIAYLALAWLLIEVAGTLFPGFDIPAWAFRFVVILLALGFIPTLIFSWAYEITPEGVKREKDVVRDSSITHHTAKRLDGVTIGLIIVALAFILADRFWLSPRFTEQLVTSAEGVSDGLQNTGTEPVAIQYPLNSIAVLPFVNMSDDAANEYFSDGISEELLNLLAKIPALRVIARTSSFAYKGKDVQIADVARELNVGHILEGSVRKAGNQVRVTAQLIRTVDSSHVWSETFDRTLDNIFTIQDEIAAEVVEQLKITLLGDTPKTHTVDPQAYALFLQARHFQNLGTVEGLQQAHELLQQALVISPGFSAAWSELGRNWQNNVSIGELDEEVGYAKAREAQNKAIELDPSNAVAYSRLGFDQLYYEMDLAAAAKLFERALALEPGNAIVLANAASLAVALGRIEQAVVLRELSQQLNPLNPAASFGLGMSYFQNEQLDKAEATVRKILLLSPNRPIIRALLVRILGHKNMLDNQEEIWSLLAEEPLEPFRLTATSAIHYKLGDMAAADATLATLVEKYSRKADGLIALVYAIRGETGKAFDSLQQAVEVEGPKALMNIRNAPELGILHDDPRWEKLLASAGLSKQQLAAIDFEFKLPE